MRPRLRPRFASVIFTTVRARCFNWPIIAPAPPNRKMNCRRWKSSITSSGTRPNAACRRSSKSCGDEPLAILRAPTGSGKTDAALIWAKHQIDLGRADRLVIAMPTRFTANQISVSSAADLSKVGLYHSSAWFKLQREKNPDKKRELRRFLEKEHGLARQIETPVTVTTLDHLCICLTGAREDHHAIFWGLANSCV